MTVPSREIRDLSNPTDLMDWWDIALEMEHELYGYLPWPRVERAVFDAQISAGWMHSGYPFMAHDLSVAESSQCILHVREWRLGDVPRIGAQPSMDAVHATGNNRNRLQLC